LRGPTFKGKEGREGRRRKGPKGRRRKREKGGEVEGEEISWPDL